MKAVATRYRRALTLDGIEGLVDNKNGSQMEEQHKDKVACITSLHFTAYQSSNRTTTRRRKKKDAESTAITSVSA